MNAPSNTNRVLTSDWGPKGLSPHLIATFWQVEREGSSRYWGRAEKDRDGKPIPSVRAALTECSVEIQPGWESPFESSGNVMPTMKAMLASGAIQSVVDPGGSASKFVSQFEGRTGVTKLNSTQVFGGMAPLKIQATALFRAWSNPVVEVEDPVNQLVKWALPEHLADDGPLMAFLEGIKQAAQGKPLDEAMAYAALPSNAPAKIAMQYKGRIYSPMVIESIGLPLSSPVTKDGFFVELLVPMVLCSLSAIDRNDWSRSERLLSNPGFRS